MLEDLKFYFSLFLRRLHYFLIVAIAVTGVGVTIAYTLPPVYEAEAQLLVESPQIPDELAASTVSVSSNEILQIIRQRLLTRANMLDIAREFDVYDARTTMSPDDMVDDMRSRISMGLPRTRDAAAFVSLSFKAETGRLSAEVVNELVTRVLEQNASIRQAASRQTLEFFRQEVARLDQELSDQSLRILDFQMANKEALPDSLDYRRTRQASLQERLLQVEREMVSLRERRDRLTAIYEQTGGLVRPEEELSPLERQLKQLQDQLASAQAIYSDQNPRVQNLRRQVEALEKRIRETTVTPSGEVQPISVFDIQMSELESQLDVLEAQKVQIETDLAALNETIEATPANAVTLSSLERDYENLRTQYNQATADLAAARTGAQIEAQSRGQRISVIEQAVIPNQPTAPDRRKIAMLSGIAGTALGLGLVALIELLNSSIRRPADLTTRLGITPIVTVPYIRTRRQRITRRLLILSALAIVAIGIPLALYLLHVYYLPMNLILEKVVDKLGLTEFLRDLGLSL
jgi:polysaccharide chain length determinant protein (PEP-CTERM system associated)